jgi:hypothetical protein
VRRGVNGGPTSAWESALISGNGTQGALCYGGPAALRVTLSHERLFLPVHRPLPAPPTAEILPQLRALLGGGHRQAAADLVVDVATAAEPDYATMRRSDPLIGAATLTFTPFNLTGDGFRRFADFETGVVGHACDDMTQEVFVSRAHDVVVVRVVGRLDGRLHLGPIGGAPQVPVEFAGSAGPSGLRLVARFPLAWAGAIRGYGVSCRATVDTGTVTAEPYGTNLVVRGARELLLVARTTVDGRTPGLDDVPADWAELLTAHAPVHRALLGDTTVRVEPRIDTLVEAGRYAITSSVGQLPPTLQGVWSGRYEPPWESDYTLDGNLQSALAAVLPLGQAGLLLPLFDLLDRYAGDLRENARRLYGLPGVFVPAHCSSHGKQNQFTERWCLTMWTAGAAWLARFHHDYWRYTGDRDFLADRALPFLARAADFYTAFVSPDGHFSPSYSPENSPDRDGGAQAAVDATMDVAAVRDLLRHLLDAVDVLGHTDYRVPVWRDLLDRLPAYRIAADGTLAEWLSPDLPSRHDHRHASHLYPLWYEPDPLLWDDPALRAAAGATVRARLAWWRRNGDEMAFGLVQLGLAAATLGLAEEAYACLDQLTRAYWRDSLVSTHNAGDLFNVDICGGYPAVVLAMLVGSRGPDQLVLLPALPAAWPSGSVRRVRARDQLTVSLAWSPVAVVATIECAGDRTITVCCPSIATEPPHRLHLRAGVRHRLRMVRTANPEPPPQQ